MSLPTGARFAPGGTRKSITVNSEAEEKAARADGYGEHEAEVAQEG